MTWAPAQPRAGYWMVRYRRLCPFVAARIWLCDHEPGDPENLMDRPYLQGQIGLDLTPPLEIWAMVEFAESAPEQQQALISPPLSIRTPRGHRAPAFQTAPLPKWQQERARRITVQAFEREIEWLTWAARNAPTHPDFLWRKPLDRNAAAAPRFCAR